MAVSNAAGILAMLKTFYAKEGVVNLLYRNDPLLKQISKERVEGSKQNFSALFSRGGAVSANATVAEELAETTAQAKEFQVTEGQIFSACTFNQKEILASKTQRGGYMPIAQAKMFAATESFRKTLALALYGTGHGELFAYASTATDTIPTGSAGAEQSFTFPKSAIYGIDIGSKLEIKTAANATSAANELEVTSINGTTVKAKVKNAVTGSAYSLASKVICLKGCTDSDGNPLLPVGLAGWLPAGTVATNDSFFGVNRSVARDRLAGSFIDHSSDSTKKHYQTIEAALDAIRVYGAIDDVVVVMNNEDYRIMANEIADKTYFTKANGGNAKTKAEVGFAGFGISFSSNYLDNVIDSPYCPKGTAYLLSMDTVKLWTYSNAEKVVDGIEGNQPGKPDVGSEDDMTNKPYQLLVDDLFSLKPGTTTVDGDAALVKINFYGTFVILDPSRNAVVKFYEG